MVYELEQSDRHAYCNCAPCVSWLLRMGWQLKDAEQFGQFVADVMAAPSTPTHNPSDHFE
jgi:hypothetical protein